MPNTPHLVIPRPRVVLCGSVAVVETKQRFVVIEFDDTPDNFPNTVYVPLGRFYETPKEGAKVEVEIRLESR